MDKIISSKNINKVNKYLFFGVMTTIINYLSYRFLVWHNIDYMLSNVIAFVLSVLFAYFTNSRWVFNEKKQDGINFNEFMSFFGCRISTLIVESVLLYFFITIIGCDKYIVKLPLNIFVVLINYILSEFIVFKK